MPRKKWITHPQNLNISGDASEIADAHAYAIRQRRSLSSIFWDLLRPRVHADKAANPERYRANRNGN